MAFRHRIATGLFDRNRDGAEPRCYPGQYGKSPWSFRTVCSRANPLTLVTGEG
jgi:hypothetical protein